MEVVNEEPGRPTVLDTPQEDDEERFAEAVTTLIMDFTITTEMVDRSNGKKANRLRTADLNDYRYEALMTVAGLMDGERYTGSHLRESLKLVRRTQPYRRVRKRSVALPWEAGQTSRGNSSR